MPIAAPATPNGVPRNAPIAAAAGLPRALAEATVRSFLAKINWSNMPPEPPAAALGGQVLRLFLSRVNWHNQPQPGTDVPLDQANPQALEAVLAEFVWD